jgi:predicted DNA-binding protein YlxM (UPF0122 family)
MKRWRLFIKNGYRMNWQKPNEHPLSEAELQMVEDMGETGFSPDEIAEVLEVDAEAFRELFKDCGGVVYKRYRKGYLQGQLKLRKRIAKDAIHGSSPAQTLMKKIYDELDYQLKQL